MVAKDIGMKMQLNDLQLLRGVYIDRSKNFDLDCYEINEKSSEETIFKRKKVGTTSHEDIAKKLKTSSSLITKDLNIGILSVEL
jgi:hypothetical protein